uniref:Protein tyrosine phosphatase n=1 Tax=Candidatus Kentrum sp. FW TaxID=2126338 RepID=A0A450TCF9_9GAMM|nr:MAG: protein tyrosine phosphatase [Candidatus Kentron sp. FW]
MKKHQPKILFVCLGNICRSPAAEGIMKSLIAKHHPGSGIDCDSAGTTDYNIGSPPNATMKSHAQQRGYRLSGASRQFHPEDFHRFDYIVTMDRSVDADIRSLTRDSRSLAKIHNITDFCRAIDAREVPDPYHGPAAGFERALDILEDACLGLLKHLTRQSSP